MPEEIATRASGAPAALRPPPTLQQLRELADGGRHAAAVALLEGVDLEAEMAADWLYYAGVAFNQLGKTTPAFGLLKRAAEGGFQPFWCAYHLGLCEVRRGNPAAAACYLTTALMLSPQQDDVIRRHLDQVAPGIRSAASLRVARAGIFSQAAAAIALDAGVAQREGGNLGAAAHYFTTALAMDGENAQARDELLRLAPDIALDLLPRTKPPESIDFDQRHSDRVRRELSVTKGHLISAAVGGDLILGFATNYTADDLEPFVCSLRDSGYTGDVVLWVSSLDEDTKAFLRHHDIQTRYCWEANFIPAHLMLYRGFCYYGFLRDMENHGRRANRVLLTDVRDVVFQADPFHSAPEGELVVYLDEESMTISSCPPTSFWLRESFGSGIVGELADFRLSCAGTVLGTWDGIIRYLLMMQLTMFDIPKKARAIEGIDQGVHNFLIYRDQLGPVTMSENGPHVLTMFHVPEDDVRIRADGRIADRDGCVSPILHQYDRHPAVAQLIEEKYRARRMR